MGFLSLVLVILSREWWGLSGEGRGEWGEGNGESGEGSNERGVWRGEAEYMFWKVYTAIWTFKHILGMEMSLAFCNR